jgi:alkylation response protein AidB-like acyl-CoA dehydrogenase
MRGLISSEQEIFGASVKRFAEQEYGFGPAQHRLSFDRARLKRLGELGVLSLAIPEALGGFGGPVEAMVALTALAPAMPPEPIVGNAIQAATLIATTASPEIAASVLEGIAAGRTIAAVADLEAAARYDRSVVVTTATRVMGEPPNVSEPLSPPELVEGSRGEGKGEGPGDGHRHGRTGEIEAQWPSPSPSPYLSPQAGRGVADVASHSAGKLPRQDFRSDRAPLAFVEDQSALEAHFYTLEGVKPLVPFGAQADLLVVSACVDGEPALFLVDATTEGILRTPRRRIDGLPAADIAFSGCRVPAASRLTGAPVIEALERAADRATAAHIAEMVGLMDALVAATIDYARTRKQFGVAIGSFQALQHRIADMWIACEEARSLAAAAALACAPGGTERERTVSAAMITACAAAHRVGSEAIQIHGGIGMTDELIVGHWYRRLWALRQETGDRRSHLARMVGLEN